MVTGKGQFSMSSVFFSAVVLFVTFSTQVQLLPVRVRPRCVAATFGMCDVASYDERTDA